MLDKVNQHIQQTQLSSGRENHQIYLFAVDSQLNSNSTKLRAYFFCGHSVVQTNAQCFVYDEPSIFKKGDFITSFMNNPLLTISYHF